MKVKFNKKFIFIFLVLFVITVTCADLTLAGKEINNIGVEVPLTLGIILVIMLLAKLLHISDFLIKHHILDEKK